MKKKAKAKPRFFSKEEKIKIICRMVHENMSSRQIADAAGIEISCLIRWKNIFDQALEKSFKRSILPTAQEKVKEPKVEEEIQVKPTPQTIDSMAVLLQTLLTKVERLEKQSGKK